MPPLYNRRDNDKLKTTPAEASREPSGSHGSWQLIRLQRLPDAQPYSITSSDSLLSLKIVFSNRHSSRCPAV